MDTERNQKATAREIYTAAYSYLREKAHYSSRDREFTRCLLMLWNCERNNEAATAAADRSFELRTAR